jgi:hypothetical protein
MIRRAWWRFAKSRNALISLGGGRLAGTAGRGFYGSNLYTNPMDFETGCFLCFA